MKEDGRAGKERNAGCVGEEDAQSEEDSLQEKGAHEAVLPEKFGLGVPEMS